MTKHLKGWEDGRNKLERSAVLCCHMSGEEMCRCFDIGRLLGYRTPEWGEWETVNGQRRACDRPPAK